MAEAHATPTPDHGDGRPRWLLVHNCQALGLANCLNLLCDEIHVEHYDRNTFLNRADDIRARYGAFERILAPPEMEAQLELDPALAHRVDYVPTMFFDGYHPDIGYVVSGNKVEKGPIGDYQSLIAYAAFHRGLSEAEALSLYRERTYAALGYLHRWDDARKRLLGSFSECGFAMEDSFVQWCRHEPFMYSNNHPRIRCLRDLAVRILQRAGRSAEYADALPHDNLANAPIFPIYPEIASALGVHGSYRFKRAGQYAFLRLPEFIAGSFALYRSRETTIHPLYRSAFDNVMHGLGTLA